MEGTLRKPFADEQGDEGDEEDEEDEEEDIYLNSVARLKVLKMKGMQKMETRRQPEVAPKPEAPVEQKASVEPEPLIVLETQQTSRGPSTRSQTRRKRAASQRARRGRGSKQPAASTDLDLEIVSVDGAPVRANITSGWDGQVVTIEDSQGSGDEEDYDVTVNVLWRSKAVHRLSVKRNESFRKIFEHFARLEGVAIEEVLITRKEKPIKRTDTPASIGFRIIDILEGGIVESTNPAAEPECCRIRVQLAEKNSMSVRVPKDGTFEDLFLACADKMAVPVSRVKLYFDGEPVNKMDTPESLDIEDEACFDFHVSS